MARARLLIRMGLAALFAAALLFQSAPTSIEGGQIEEEGGAHFKLRRRLHAARGPSAQAEGGLEAFEEVAGNLEEAADSLQQAEKAMGDAGSWREALHGPGGGKHAAQVSRNVSKTVARAEHTVQTLEQKLDRVRARLDEDVHSTTADLSKVQLRRRKLFFVSIIAVLVGTLVMAASWVAYRKAAEGSTVLGPLPLCGLGPLELKGGQGWFLNGKPLSAAKSRTTYKTLTSGNEASEETESTTVDEAEDENLDLPAREESMLDKMQKEQLQEELERKEKEEREKHAEFLLKRRIVLTILYLVYVSSCIGIPLMNASSVSCVSGFFWETHILFLCIFFGNKVIELGMYAYDETIMGTLKLKQMMMRFLPSFLGYSDGYMDLTAVIIAHACLDEPFAQQLAQWMSYTYVGGVVVLQWLLVGIMAMRDPSQACLMKLLHMDALASCVTLDSNYKQTWDMIHLARTIGEDIPQAFLQTLYIIYVQKNYFMMVSVLMGLVSSIKAINDAVNRRLTASGALEKLFDSVGNGKMVRLLKEDGKIKSRKVMDAMLAVERGYYAPTDPYEDSPQRIGHNATISAPHMHAMSLEVLTDHLKPGAKVLDVGCGSGYLSACLARMVGPTGKVTAIDYIPELVDLSKKNLTEAQEPGFLEGTLQVMAGEGWEGCPDLGPFDVIYVGAAAEEMPEPLKEQLKPGGRMLIPVQDSLTQVDRKADGTFEEEELMSVRFVPLVRPQLVGNAKLIKELEERGKIKSRAVKQAMLAVDRGYYAPTDPYEDRPQKIGHAATISAPHMHAHALEVMADHLKPGAKVLDVGCGSGYLSACLAQMVGPTGKVMAIDYIPELVELSRKNLTEAQEPALDNNLTVQQGEGWNGCPEAAPFDVIHVGAAAESMPEKLKEQLKEGGRMVIPIGGDWTQVDRLPGGTFEEKKLMSVRFVPLVKPTAGA